MRMRWDADYMADDIFWPEDELYYKDEPNNEEGWATENQVCSAHGVMSLRA